MQITINGNKTHLEEATTLRMERRLYFALGRFGNAINRISVRLTDINGPKGGPDKHCLIVVKLRKGGEIVVQGKGLKSDMALNHCADRISRAVDRELSRRRRTPIRKMRRLQNAERAAVLESEERINGQIEPDSMAVSLLGLLALTTDRTEQKLITQCKTKSQEENKL